MLAGGAYGYLFIYKSTRQGGYTRRRYGCCCTTRLNGAGCTSVGRLCEPGKGKPFKPNPTKAVILSAILPGLGQIYNKAYWKLPIVYGGFMGCIYAITWNNKNYKDYSTAYFDLMYDVKNNADDPSKWSSSWTDIAKKNGYDPEKFITTASYQDNIKRRKDYFRRYRDLSIIITAGVYAICMIDAYVDAQLFDFDISPDLSMRVEPMVMPKTSVSERIYGLNCSIKF